MQKIQLYHRDKNGNRGDLYATILYPSENAALTALTNLKSLQKQFKKMDVPRDIMSSRSKLPLEQRTVLIEKYIIKYVK